MAIGNTADRHMFVTSAGVGNPNLSLSVRCVMLSCLTNPVLVVFLDLGLGLSLQSLYGEAGNWF